MLTPKLLAGFLILASAVTVPAAQKTWTGGATDFNWGSGANWGGTAPVSGDDLLFTGATRLSNSNSIVGLAINSLSYSAAGFNHVGQALRITNGIVDLAGNNTNAIPLTLGATQGFTNISGQTLVFTGTLNMSNNNLTIGGGSDVLLNGVISGSNNVAAGALLTLNISDGLVRLGAANTFNGDVNVNSGTLRLGNAAAIPSGNFRGNLFVASGATLDFGAQSPTINGLNGAGLVDEASTNVGNFTLTLGAANSNGVFSGTIQNTYGTVSVAKNGTGEQVLSGNNSFAGALTVNAGVLRLEAANAYTGATTISGGALVFGSLASVASTNFVIGAGGLLDVSAVAGGLTFDGNLRGGRTTGFTNDVTGSITLNGGNITPVVGLAGTLTMGGNLTLNGGTLNLDLNNVTTVGGGVNDLIALTNGGNLTLGGTTFVKIKPLAGSLAGGTYTVINGSAAPIVGGPGNLQLAAPRGITAVFDTATDPTSLRVTAAGSATPATVTWAGNGAGGAWDVLVSQNWLSNAVPDFYYDLDSVVFTDVAGAANAVVNLPNSVSPTSVTVSNNAFNYTLGVINADPGFISGLGGLTKNGSGIVALNAPNNFTGPTIVNRGGIALGSFITGTFVDNITLYNSVTPGTLTLGNGGLFLPGVANTQHSARFGMLTLNPGGSAFAQRNRQSNAGPFWRVDGVTRNVGGTLDFNNIQTRNAAFQVGFYFTNVAPVNGIMGGYATWALNDWVVPTPTNVNATINGSYPLGLAGMPGGYQTNNTSSAWGATSNINVTATPSAIAASQVVNSLRMPAAATVTVNAGQSLTLASGGLLVPNNASGAATITGGTLLGAPSADLILLQNSGANALTVGSVIADNGGATALTKAGQGTAILTGNNTYSGVTYINGPTLSGNNNGNNLPTTIAAGILQIGNNGATGGISNSPSVVNLGTLSFSRSDTIGYPGLISGTGGVRQQGSGTTILPADNTYAGPITITAGTLRIGTGGASGSFSNAASVANAGALVINRTGTLGYDGQIRGLGSLTVQGGGNLVLSSNQTYTGSTTISAGKIVLGANASISNSALISIAAGAVLDAAAPGGLTLNGAGGGQVVAGNGGVSGQVTAGSNTRLSPGGDGVIGTLTLSNALTLNGGTVTLDLSGGGSRDLLDVKGNLDLTAGTIALNNIGGAIPSGSYKLIGYTGNLSGNVNDLALSGFSQPGQLASLSAETPNEIRLVVVTGFGADLTWLGDGAGNLWNLLGAFNFTNSSGVVTNFRNNDQVSFTDAGASNASVNLVGSLTAASVLVNSTTDYTFQGSGRISGGSAVVKNGPNNLTILATNNYSGPTTVNGGSVILGNGIDTDGSLGIGSVTNNATVVFNNLGDQTVSGGISGSGRINFNGAGKVTLAGNNSGFSGPATINAGFVQVGTGGAAGTLGTGPVTNNTAVVINRSGALTVSSAITGSGALTNDGVGAVTLSGANTYTGPTFINNGTVKAGSTAAIPSGVGAGNVVLNAGASAAGILDLNGFDVNLNGLDGANGTVLGQVVNNTGTATNRLIVGNGDADGNFSGIIRDNSGAGGKITLVKRGAGTNTLNISQALGNLYTGGTIISNGILQIATPGGGSPVVVGANGVALGSGPVTFYGGTLAPAGSIPQSTGPNWGAFANTLIVPAGQSGTILGVSRGAINSTLLGSGTFTYIAAYVRGEMGGDWSGFTGQIILQGESNGNGMGLNSAIGFPNARVYITNNNNYGLTLYGRVAGTPTIPIGELAGGDDGTSIISTSPTGAGGLAANFMIGGLNTSTNYDGRIGDNVGLIKVGTGTLTLTNVNLTYTGITTVSNGALVLVGAIPPSSSFNLTAPGVLDISALGTLTAGSATAQTVQGNGTLRGSLDVQSLGILAPGYANAIGTLTVTNTVSLSGTTRMELNRTNLVGGTNDALVAPTIALGGTLTVTNLGTALAAGNTFKLFNASGGISGNFAVVELITNDVVNNLAYTWTDNTAVNGSITVLSATPLVNVNPTNITTSVSGGQITLSWPASHTGWRLQIQTNTLSVGLGANWFDVAGSPTTNQIQLPIVTTNGAVFFRMIYP